jgi:hypothetical protein
MCTYIAEGFLCLQPEVWGVKYKTPTKGGSLSLAMFSFHRTAGEARTKFETRLQEVEVQ